MGSAPLHHHKRSMTPISPFRFRLFSADETNNNNSSKTHSRLPLHRTFSKSASLPSISNMNELEAPGSPVYTMDVNDNPFQLDASQDITDETTVSSISASSVRRLADIVCPDLDSERPPPSAIFVRSVSTEPATTKNSDQTSEGEEEDVIYHSRVSPEDDNDAGDKQKADQQLKENHADPLSAPPTAEWQKAWVQGGTKPPPTSTSAAESNRAKHSTGGTRQNTLTANVPVPVTPSPEPIKKKPPVALRRCQTTTAASSPTARRVSTGQLRRVPSEQSSRSRPQHPLPRPPTIHQRAVTDAAVLLGNRPRRQLPLSTETVISFGSRVGQSTVLTPNSNSATETNLSDTKPTARTNFVKQDLQHFWKVVSQPVRRWTHTEEKIDLRRNTTGCLT